MIVECVGSTGAGKSTLLAALHQALNVSQPVTTAFALVAGGRPWLTHPTLRNLAQDLSTLPYVGLGLGHHGRFLAFAVRILARHRPLTLHTLNYLRSVLRKLGTHELLRHRGASSNALVLVDEGTILAAHNLFVYTNTRFGAAEVAQFGRLVPLPDAVIYLRASVPTLVQRTLQRPDPPRELRGRNTATIRAITQRAAHIFDAVTATPEIAARCLIVDETPLREQAATVGRILRWLQTQPAWPGQTAALEKVTYVETDSPLG